MAFQHYCFLFFYRSYEAGTKLLFIIINNNVNKAFAAKINKLIVIFRYRYINQY